MAAVVAALPCAGCSWPQEARAAAQGCVHFLARCAVALLL